ncbi:MAG: hypothetical protein CL661_03350 [Bacteroidetes bacterium]|nr:hypothetical protein [Bacteroidota bacterium]|tara:strand:+ start:77 stop:502 length:426 start_codon:yes stop_codon:yes gene_type:complete
MRKLLLVLSLLVLFFVGTGMKSLEAQNCWLEIDVDWYGDCVKVNTNTVYVVNVTVINECSDPDETVFTETQTLATTIENTTFCIEDALCTVDQLEPCFRIYFTIAKVHNVTQEIICSNQESTSLLTCEQLMNFSSYSIPLD